MKQYIVDAFTDKVFAGNPAAICILEKWLTDELMIFYYDRKQFVRNCICCEGARRLSFTLVYAGR